MECYIIKPAQSLHRWSAFRNHQGSTFTEKDRNKLNYRIGPLRSDSVIKLVSDLITESDQAVRAVHTCNSWLLLFSCTTIHRYLLFSTRYSVMCKVYTGYHGTSEIEHGLCVCTVDNPLCIISPYRRTNHALSLTLPV